MTETERERPNFLIFMVDEERYPPVYENEEIRAWRKRYLLAQDMLRETGVEFRRHYAASTACCPSRSSFFTGQYPSLHGVTQTPGAAKQSYDPGMFWLDPNTVPTLGDYFRAAGYRTFYKGKWHVSDADIIIPGTHDPLMTWAVGEDNRPVPIPRNIEVYRKADKLEEYGFSGWVGPEPHGSAQANCGMNRDEGFMHEAVELLDRLEAEYKTTGGGQRPWLLVNSYVNPHDIALFGLVWKSWGYQFTDDTVPDIPESPTDGEDLRTKPRCQESFVNVYPHMLMPQPPIEIYRKFYYYLQKLSDGYIRQVYERLRRSPFFENTVVVYTSDHGDLLGAHGGMHQKWHCAYEEAIHVPLIISNPRHVKDPRAVETLTSHVDLVPTLLALAGADQKEVQETAARDHCEVRPLVGRDLSALVRGDGAAVPNRPVYYMTDDEVSEGQSQFNPLTKEFYHSVVQPNHVETVIALLRGKDGAEEVWKYSRYFDNVDFWTDPTRPGRHDVVHLGEEQQTRRVPAPDEYEMYNLTLDPLEERNLCHPSNQTEETRAREKELRALLAEQNAAKRLTPGNKTAPGLPSGGTNQPG